MAAMLSEHFSVDEWACKGTNCCNHSCPDPSFKLMMGLEALRTRTLQGVLRINCGYRCTRHNTEVGGAPESYHPRNMAADVSSPGMSGKQLALQAENVDAFRHGGIGIYPDRIHVDIGPMRRWVKHE